MWRSLPHARAPTHVKVSGRKVQRVSGLGWILEQHRAVTGEVEDDNRAAGAPERDIVGLQPPGRVTHVPVLVKRKPAIFWIVLLISCSVSSARGFGASSAATSADARLRTRRRDRHFASSPTFDFAHPPRRPHRAR